MRNVAEMDFPVGTDAFVAQQQDFALARERFADGREIGPAIVVVVEGCNSPGAHPSGIREREALERRRALRAFAAGIAPEAQTGRRPVREGEVHAAVVIEIERDGARRARRRFAHPRGSGSKRAFERIHEDLGRFFPAGDDQIDGAIVIQIAFESGDGCGAAGEPRLLGVIAERAATEIAPKNIAGRRGVVRERERLRRNSEREIIEARDVDVEVAIVVVIDEGDAEREADRAHAGRIGDIFKCAVAFVVKQRDAVAGADDEIGMAVVVVVADGAAGAFAEKFELCGFCDVDEAAVAGVVEERGCALAIGVDEKNVGLAVAIVIEDAGTAAEEVCEI